MKIDIKPLSINEAWQGKRYKTKVYRQYRANVGLLLPSNAKIPENHKLSLKLKFGLSNAGADIDNPVKPFLDCLQDKYGINDNRIYQLKVKKVIVDKGQEFISFKLKGIKD